MARDAWEYSKGVATKINIQDEQMWALISDVPMTEQPYPLLCAILNIIVPGTGTILATCVADDESWSKTQFFIGFLQLATCILIIGWVWSGYWGYLLIMKNKQAQQ